MRQQKLDFRVLSRKQCETPHCRRRIKQNVIDRKPHTQFCFPCFVARQAQRGHMMRDFMKYRRVPAMV